MSVTGTSLLCPPGTKTDSSPLSRTICPPGSPEATTKLWLCLWQAAGGVCWAVEPKPCLSGKHDRFLIVSLGDAVLEKPAALGREGCSLPVCDAPSCSTGRGSAAGGAGRLRVPRGVAASGSHPSHAHSLTQETLALPWALVTRHHRAFGLLWPAERGPQGPAWPASGPALVLRESLPSRSSFTSPPGYLQFPPSRTPIEPSPLPTFCTFFQAQSPCPLPGSRPPLPGWVSLPPQPTLGPGRSLGMSAPWLFTGHGWMAGAASGAPCILGPPGTAWHTQVSGMTQVADGCCGHLSSGGDRGFGPLNKPPPGQQACVFIWGFFPEFPGDCSPTPLFPAWEEPALEL